MQSNEWCRKDLKGSKFPELSTTALAHITPSGGFNLCHVSLANRLVALENLQNSSKSISGALLTDARILTFFFLSFFPSYFEKNINEFNLCHSVVYLNLEWAHMSLYKWRTAQGWLVFPEPSWIIISNFFPLNVYRAFVSFLHQLACPFNFLLYLL